MRPAAPTRAPTAVAVAIVAVLGLAGCFDDAAPPAGPGPSAHPTAPAGPEIGAWHGLVYDDRLGATVLVNGGPERVVPPDRRLELWSWDGTAWRLLNADGPSVRNFAAVAYDQVRDVVVVHGGITPGGDPLAETWEWDGARWQRFDAAALGGREGSVMTYDPVRELVLLYGGAVGAEVRADTWSWDGRSWQLESRQGPPARFADYLVFDEARQDVVLYGGHVITETGPPAIADTWLWDGRRWREADAESAPGPRVNARAVFDAGTRRVLMVGGGNADNETRSDVWAWDGSGWTRLAERALPPRQGHGLAYDRKRGVVVLTGGLDRPGTGARHQDVWEWSGTSFAQVYPAG